MLGKDISDKFNSPADSRENIEPNESVRCWIFNWISIRLFRVFDYSDVFKRLAAFKHLQFALIN